VLRLAQECSPSAQVRAAAAHVQTLKQNQRKKKVESDLCGNNNNEVGYHIETPDNAAFNSPTGLGISNNSVEFLGRYFVSLFTGAASNTTLNGSNDTITEAFNLPQNMRNSPLEMAFGRLLPPPCRDMFTRI
jgi:hypothetical protein